MASRPLFCVYPCDVFGPIGLISKTWMMQKHSNSCSCFILQLWMFWESFRLEMNVFKWIWKYRSTTQCWCLRPVPCLIYMVPFCLCPSHRLSPRWMVLPCPHPPLPLRDLTPAWPHCVWPQAKPQRPWVNVPNNFSLNLTLQYYS